MRGGAAPQADDVGSAADAAAEAAEIGAPPLVVQPACSAMAAQLVVGAKGGGGFAPRVPPIVGCAGVPSAAAAAAEPFTKPSGPTWKKENLDG